MSGQEELLELAFVQRGTGEGLAVLEIGLHAAEGAIQTISHTSQMFQHAVHGGWRGEPVIMDRAVLFDQPGIVGNFFRIDLDQVFIVEEQFGAEFVAVILKIAVPCVARLIPHLDCLQIQSALREHIAVFALEIAHFKRHFPVLFEGIDHKGCGFVLIECGIDPQRRARRAVCGVGVRQVLHFAHSGYRIVDETAGDLSGFGVGDHTGDIGLLFFRTIFHPVGMIGPDAVLAGQKLIRFQPFSPLFGGGHFHLCRQGEQSDTGKECGQKRFCFHSGPFLLYDDGDSIYCYINAGNNKIKKKSLNNIPVLLPQKEMLVYNSINFLKKQLIFLEKFALFFRLTCYITVRYALARV